MSTTSARIQRIIPLDRRLEGRPDVKLAFLHKSTVVVPGVPGAVTVSVNIQPAREYYGLAAKSARLPTEQRCRYVVAKALAKMVASPTIYRLVKQHWTDLIYWLAARRYYSAKTSRQHSILLAASRRFPLFFSRPPPASTARPPTDKRSRRGSRTANL